MAKQAGWGTKRHAQQLDRDTRRAFDILEWFGVERIGGPGDGVAVSISFDPREIRYTAESGKQFVISPREVQQ